MNTDYGDNYYSKMLEADRFYKQGDLQTAKKIQQEVKPDFPPPELVPNASGEVSQLSLEAQQNWASVRQAIAADPQEVIEVRMFQPLEALVDNNPQFVPGHVLLADTYDYFRWQRTHYR